MTSPSRDEPLALFQEWYEAATRQGAERSQCHGPRNRRCERNAQLRMVLLKDIDDRGFVFYTNLKVQGQELKPRPRRLPVLPLEVPAQAGPPARPRRAVTAAEADEYFASRPRESRIGAWASQQSRPLESRFALEKRSWPKTPPASPWARCRGRPIGRASASFPSFEFWKDRPFSLQSGCSSRGLPPARPGQSRLYP